MIQGIINDILEAEKKAEEIVKEAEMLSNKEIDNVDKKISVLNDDTTLYIKNTRKNIIDKANQEAEKFYEYSIETAKDDILKMQKECGTKVESIAKDLVGRIID